MKFKHIFKHVDVSESLKSHAEERFDKVGRLLLKDSTWQIFYSMSRKKDCVVEVTVSNPESYFKAQAQSDSFYETVDEVAQKLSKQFLRRKEKLQHHKDYQKSKEGRMERLNERLEYNNSPYFNKKSA